VLCPQAVNPREHRSSSAPGRRGRAGRGLPGQSPARGAPDAVPRSGAALITTKALSGNAMKLSLDANYRQLGRWRSQAQVQSLPRSVAVIGCRLGCCAVVLHVQNLDA
jgi:hypothetical protein